MSRVLPIPVLLFAGAFFLFVALAFSNAHPDILAAFAFVLGGTLWGLVWLVRLVVSLIRQRRGSIPRQSFRKALFYWGFEPAVLLLCIVCLSADVFRPVRFYLSRTALDDYVTEVLSGPPGRYIPQRRVGLYRVLETEVRPDGVVRIITSWGLNDGGFIYSPTPPPRVDTYTHFTGRWYYWNRNW